jgi:hypothetical protein
MQNRHPPLSRGGAGLCDGLRLRPKLVEQRDHGGLIVARIRLVIRGARIVGGVTDFLHRGLPMARQGSQGQQGTSSGAVETSARASAAPAGRGPCAYCRKTRATRSSST